MTSPTEAAPVAAAAITVADEAALGRLAAQLAAMLGNCSFVTLAGDLGAGKTTFVKALAAAVGIEPAEVTSPTFGLIHVYEPPAAPGTPDESRGAARLVHADMYRLTDPGELAETGWGDAIAGDAWVLVEWPERIAAALPPERIDVVIEITAPTARVLTFMGRGAAAAAIVGRLATG